MELFTPLLGGKNGQPQLYPIEACKRLHPDQSEWRKKCILLLGDLQVCLLRSAERHASAVHKIARVVLKKRDR